MEEGREMALGEHLKEEGHSFRGHLKSRKESLMKKKKTASVSILDFAGVRTRRDDRGSHRAMD